MKTISCMKYLLLLFLFTAMGCEKNTTDQTFTIGKESSFRLNQIDYSADGQYTLLIKEIIALSGRSRMCLVGRSFSER